MSDREITEQVVRVHLENADDINVRKTEEHEPEHFVFTTVVVAFNVNGYNNSEQVLALDLLRKDASILSVDQPVVICHSHSQMTDPANQVGGVPYPQGAYLPAGSSLTFSGTGPMWVVATVNQPSRISIAVNRRAKLWDSAEPPASYPHG
jgi:hypothetical protein